MNKALIVILSVLLLGLVACEKEVSTPEPTSFDNKYFPLIVGNSISYQIEEIVIDVATAVNDTLAYQIKEKIESLIEDVKTHKSYRLERYYRKTSVEEWVLLNVWQLRQYQTRIQKIEDNIEYLRLITPVESHVSWDGNLYNHKDAEDCEVSKIEAIQIGSKNLETAFVTHFDSSSLIDKKFSEEQYADGIGLVNKTEIDVELNIDPNLPWDEKITKETIFYQQLIEYNE